MTQQNSVLPLTYLVVVLFPGMLELSNRKQTAQAQPISQNSNPSVNITFEPPNRDRPQDSDGSQCSQNPKSLEPDVTLLLPVDRYGLTVESHPTFFVYLPPTTAQKAFFSIRDENDRDFYETFISLPEESGVISVKLPADAPSLEKGKAYKWSFVLMCDNALRPARPLVEGQIERTELNSASLAQLEKATFLERATFYGKAGIWYETLTNLADARRSQPANADLEVIWQDLLRSVALEAIASQPLLR